MSDVKAVDSKENKLPDRLYDLLELGQAVQNKLARVITELEQVVRDKENELHSLKSELKHYKAIAESGDNAKNYID